MSKLTEKAVALLQEGEVNLVIGYEEGNHGTRPLFCRQAENADRLILDDRCTNNIAVYLTKRELTGTGTSGYNSYDSSITDDCSIGIRKPVERR